MNKSTLGQNTQHECDGGREEKKINLSCQRNANCVREEEKVWTIL